MKRPAGRDACANAARDLARVSAEAWPAPGIAFAPPPGWEPAAIGKPAMGQATWLHVATWHSWRAPGGDAWAASGCIAGDLRGWTPEATPIALDRLGVTVSGILARLDLPTALRTQRETIDRGVAERWLEGGDGDGTLARTFLGFSPGPDSQLLACLAICAPARPACDAALGLAAPTSGLTAPPAPVASVRALTFAVHHSRATSILAGSLFVLAGVAAVWTRPRPRRK